MTRQQAKANLEAFGIVEVTEEQITNYLNQVNGETINERKRADKFQADSVKAAELQAQIDEINSKSLSDIEKAQFEMNKYKALYEAEQKEKEKMLINAKLTEIGIVGEHQEKFFGEDGKVDFNVLGQILTQRAIDAAAQKEKELLDRTPNPQGNNGGANGDDTRSEAEKYVTEHLGNNANTFADNIAAYK